MAFIPPAQTHDAAAWQVGPPILREETNGAIRKRSRKHGQYIGDRQSTFPGNSWRSSTHHRTDGCCESLWRPTPYRIQLALEEDGWHVDYELKEPRLKGGGPHYLIDAFTGVIRSKKYQQ
jgi:hypothetical protein